MDGTGEFTATEWFESRLETVSKEGCLGSSLFAPKAEVAVMVGKVRCCWYG